MDSEERMKAAMAAFEEWRKRIEAFLRELIDRGWVSEGQETLVLEFNSLHYAGGHRPIEAVREMDPSKLAPVGITLNLKMRLSLNTPDSRQGT